MSRSGGSEAIPRGLNSQSSSSAAIAQISIPGEEQALQAAHNMETHIAARGQNLCLKKSVEPRRLGAFAGTMPASPLLPARANALAFFMWCAAAPQVNETSKIIEGKIGLVGIMVWHRERSCPCAQQTSYAYRKRSL